MKTRDNYEASSTKSFGLIITSRALVLIAVAVVVTLLAYLLVAPGNATLGYHLASVIIPLISYSIILIVIAALIARGKGKFKTHTLLIFG